MDLVLPSVRVAVIIFVLPSWIWIVLETCWNCVKLSKLYCVFYRAWCPYQAEKLIPCRVRNGTEPYYGANICWRNENGSYACNKKILGYRAKYSTTYKKIMETKYKCCPGRDGSECENGTFNLPSIINRSYFAFYLDFLCL